MPIFDQIVRGNIKIKKHPNRPNIYDIKFSKAGEFLVYQVWSKTNNNNDNNNRKTAFVNAKKWVIGFQTKRTNDFFTPTTIMEIGNKKYIFAINNVFYDKNSKYKMIFNVSVKSFLQNDTKKSLIHLPVNKKYKNVRFDIDGTCMPSLGITSGCGSTNPPGPCKYGQCNSTFLGACVNQCCTSSETVNGSC